MGKASKDKSSVAVADCTPHTLISRPQACEVPQLEHYSNAKRLLTLYKNKMDKASKEVRDAFTLQKVAECY